MLTTWSTLSPSITLSASNCLSLAEIFKVQSVIPSVTVQSYSWLTNFTSCILTSDMILVLSLIRHLHVSPDWDNFHNWHRGLPSEKSNPLSRRVLLDSCRRCSNEQRFIRNILGHFHRAYIQRGRLLAHPHNHPSCPRLVHPSPSVNPPNQPWSLPRLWSTIRRQLRPLSNPRSAPARLASTATQEQRSSPTTAPLRPTAFLSSPSRASTTAPLALERKKPWTPPNGITSRS